MTDTVRLLHAAKLGYSFNMDDLGGEWYITPRGACIGPFKNLDAAVDDALAEYEINSTQQQWSDKCKV